MNTSDDHTIDTNFDLDDELDLEGEFDLDTPGTSGGADREPEFVLPSLDDTVQIADGVVRSVLRVLDHSNLADDIEGWEADDRKGPGGAKPALSARTVLCGLLVSVRALGGVLDTDVTRVLYHAISPEMRAELGVEAVAPGQGEYKRVNGRINKVLSLIDPTVTVKNRVVLKTDALRMAPTLTTEEQAIRYKRMDHLTHTILRLSFLCLPWGVRRRWKGSIAVDGTPLRQFARGTSADSLFQSSDPDSAWYNRSASDLTVNDDSTWSPSGNLTPVAQRPRRGSRSGAPVAVAYRNRKASFWGLEATLAVMTDERIDGVSEFPKLTLGAVIDKPGFRIGENATRTLRLIAEWTGKTGFLAGDRAYSNSQPDKFQIPTKQLGYKHIFDYRIDQLGRAASYAGAIQVEGAWYCPSMPEALIEATRDHRENRISSEQYHARIADRARFAMRVKGYDQHGRPRFKCPAETSPLAACPLKVEIRENQGQTAETVTAVALAIKPSKAVTEDPPEVCTKKSVTFPIDIGAKFNQELPFGSQEHTDRYAILRNTIEGFNGIAKDGAHEGLADATRRRKRGLAAQSLYTAVLIFATNLRKIDTFLKKAKKDRDDVLQVTRAKRARTKSQRLQDAEATADTTVTTATDTSHQDE